jgi:predicted transcriptional regulator
MNKIVRKFEVSKTIDAAIDKMAKETARSPSQVVADAIEQLQTDYDDLSIEAARWAEYERTGKSIDLGVARKRLQAKLTAKTRRRRAQQA